MTASDEIFSNRNPSRSNSSRPIQPLRMKFPVWYVGRVAQNWKTCIVSEAGQSSIQASVGN
jgi:hypothetical protein